MPHWVKRQVVWTEEAQIGIAVLLAAGQVDIATAAKCAVDMYAARGDTAPHLLEYFASGPWRGFWRIKQFGQPSGFRVLFRDSPMRRRVVVKRVRLREIAYLDPPG